MSTNGGLAARIAQEQDDLLATIQLVGSNDELVGHLFESLVDRLVASLFIDLRQQHLDGHLDDAGLASELLELTAQCRAVGIQPPV